MLTPDYHDGEIQDLSHIFVLSAGSECKAQFAILRNHTSVSAGDNLCMLNLLRYGNALFAVSAAGCGHFHSWVAILAWRIKGGEDA